MLPRRRTGLPLASSLLIVLLASPAASGEGGFPAAPFRPTLQAGAGHPVCQRFADAWRAVFDSEKPLTETHLDLESAFPGASVWSFPPEKGTNGVYGGLYEETHTLTLDLDGDGSPEVLHIEGPSIGWRYMGVNLYLFESEAEHAAATARFRAEFPHRQALGIWRLSEPLTPEPRKLLNAPPADVVHILRFEGETYATSPPPENGYGVLETALFHLNGPDGSVSLCRLQLMPEQESLAAFQEQSDFYRAFLPFYGGPPEDGACLGTMGWTARPLPEPFLQVLHRPQAAASSLLDGDAGPVTTAAAMELRYLSWGLQDPVSWRYYLRWKSAGPGFQQKLADHYLRHFTDSPAKAQAMAEAAYRYIGEKVIYARNAEGFLTATALAAADRLDISAEDSPKEMVATVMDYLSRLPRRPAHPDIAIAAMYTGQPVERVRQAMEDFENAQRAGGRNDPDTSSARRQLLLASLGDPSFIDMALTIEPDARTNDFGKTALMYAAQTDNEAAVRHLLRHGANPDIATSTADVPCVTLERDNRTALMYAAENAGVAVIDLLLAHGADPARTDSKGNDAAWYLQRNARLSAEQKADIAKRMEGN